MISTVNESGRWLLVSSTTGRSSNAAAGAMGSKSETIQCYWTGLAWSAQACDGKGFASQGEALTYRKQHTATMEADS